MPDDQASGRTQRHRGREASAPHQIPAPGWRDILLRTWSEISESNIFLAAGGVTYAVLVALFPGLAALVSIYGLVMNPSQIEAQVHGLTGILPPETRQMIGDELHQLVSSSQGALGVGVVIGLLVALWSASRGMSGAMTALNIAYQEKEKRGFLKFNAIALALTLGLIVAGIVAIVLVAGLPAAVQFLGLRGFLKWLLLVIQWPVLAVLMVLGLAVLYRYAPSREEPQWRWISPGAIAATLLWIIASVAFTVYVSNFGSYNKTYGSLGGIIVLLTWLYITSVTVLLGAAINAQAERQTRRDTTTGPPSPPGQRGAYAADTVGPDAGGT